MAEQPPDVFEWAHYELRWRLPRLTAHHLLPTSS